MRIMVFVLLLATGCASVDRPIIDKTQAYLMLKAGQKTPTIDQTAAIFEVRIKDASGNVIILPGRNPPNQHLLRAVAAGTYTYDALDLIIGLDHKTVNARSGTRQLTGTSFQLRAGEVMYLGDYEGETNRFREGQFIKTVVEIKSINFNLERTASEMVTLFPDLNGFSFKEIGKP